MWMAEIGDVSGVENTSLLCLLTARVKCSLQRRSTRSLAFAIARQGVGVSNFSLSWSALSSSNWCDGTCMMKRSGC